jgi:hypothetical protein
MNFKILFAWVEFLESVSIIDSFAQLFELFEICTEKKYLVIYQLKINYYKF